jgi:hypothetical protein
VREVIFPDSTNLKLASLFDLILIYVSLCPADRGFLVASKNADMQSLKAADFSDPFERAFFLVLSHPSIAVCNNLWIRSLIRAVPAKSERGVAARDIGLPRISLWGVSRPRGRSEQQSKENCYGF